MFVSIEAEEDAGPIIAEARLRTTIVPANVQVAFSIVSVDCAAPPNWFALPKLESNPPPFEFCTSTTRINKIEAAMIKTVITVGVLIYFRLFFLF
jgi:hypothetical protein